MRCWRRAFSTLVKCASTKPKKPCALPGLKCGCKTQQQGGCKPALFFAGRAAAGKRAGALNQKKAGLNKAILDQGWGEFRRQLEYKMAWAGGLFIAVPAHHTSQTCPCCGHVAKENRLTQAKFLCVDCGHAENADVVGAINVLERGQRLLACGEDGSGRCRKTRAKPASVKQEPTEATMREASHA